MVSRSSPTIYDSVDNDDADTYATSAHSYSRSGSDSEETNTKLTDKLVAKETRIVLMLRIAVIFVLIACATAVAFTIYNLTKTSEIDAFKIQYEGASEKVLNAFEDILLVHAGSLASLSVAITTQGQSFKICEKPIIFS
jgi:hypothetical protein